MRIHPLVVTLAAYDHFQPSCTCSKPTPTTNPKGRQQGFIVPKPTQTYPYLIFQQ